MRHSTIVLKLAAVLALAGCFAVACVDDEYVTAPAGSAGGGGIASSVSAGGASAAGSGGSCADQCPEPTQVCVGRTCTDGQCGTALEPAGAISPWQIPGDCKSFMCDGQGSATEVPDYADTLDDQNACTADACSSTGPVNQPVVPETPCSQNGGKYCNASAECVECITDAHCGAELCLAGQCVPQACANMVQDPDETGLNCGGPCGATCEPGQGCLAAGDCVHGVCVGNVCAAPTCNDGVKNGDESDIDCGGSCATKCGPHQTCTAHADCAGDHCSGSICIPNCHDSVKNNAETDVDCGGPTCADCSIGADCQAASDCFSGHCTDGKCCAIACGGTCVACAEAMTGAIDGTCGPLLSGQNAICDQPRAVNVQGGVQHVCAVLSDGRLKCWGNGNFAALGVGEAVALGDNPGEMGAALPAVQLGSGKSAIAFAGGYHNSCAILNDGSVKCWGVSTSGAVPLGGTVWIGDEPGEMGDALPPVALGTGRTAVSIGGRWVGYCVLLDNGSIKCWGAAGSGRLGLGDAENRGDNPGEMGDNLPPVNLGTGKLAINLAVGAWHACALLNDHTVKCWGDNSYGQLGLGDIENRGDDPGEMGDNLPAVQLGTGVKVVGLVAGFFHTCAQLDDGGIKCWGGNTYGQLGLGDANNRGDDPGEMGVALVPVSLGTGKTAMSISVGARHTCAVLNDGTMKCWGANEYGQLGLGDTTSRGALPGEMGDLLPPISLGPGRTALSAFSCPNQTCALLDDHSLKCWGWNSAGTLGLGDTADRGDNPGEMGDALPTVKLFSDVW